MTLLLALFALQVAAPLPEPLAEPLDVSVVIGEAAAKEAVSSLGKCTTRSFQASAQSTVDGNTSQANIALCSKPGDSDTQWLKTLQTTSDMVVASSVSADAKAKLTSELQAEMARVRSQMIAEKSSQDD